MNIQKLVNISVGDSVDISAFGDAFTEALAKHKEQQLQEAANELVKLLGLVEQQKDAMRAGLRNLRKQMETYTKQLDTIDKAVAFAAESKNYIPLLTQVQHMLPYREVPVITPSDRKEAMDAFEKFTPKKKGK